MSKRIIIFAVLMICLMMSVSPISASIVLKNGSSEVSIDGLPCDLKQSIPVVDGTAMVPTRLLAIEGDLELKVGEDDWQEYHSGSRMLLKVKSGVKHVIKEDDNKVELKRAPFVKSGNLYVPAKTVAELLGMKVEWNEKENTISIEKRSKPTEDPSWIDSLIKNIGTELFFFLMLGLVIFFGIAFFVLTPLRRRWWGQD